MSLIIYYYLYKFFKSRPIFIVVLVGYLLRLFFMFWDLYGKAIFILPHSGSDTEGFYIQGMKIAEDLKLLFKMPMGSYADFLGVFFKIFGDQQILARYVNVLLGLGIIIVLYKILKHICIQDKIINFSIVLISFFPQAIIFSAILLRENLVTFTLIMMFYSFIKWIENGSSRNLLLSFVWLTISTFFHSGVIGAVIPLSFMYMFYSRTKKKFSFSAKSTLVFVIIISSGVVVYLTIGDILLSKFGLIKGGTLSEFLENLDLSYVAAGSKYLSWIKFDSIIDVFKYAPLKLVYFLFSPFPFDWRGSIDIATFILDSLVYIYLIIYILKNIKKVTNNRNLIYIILFMFFIIAVTFSFGTVAAGTAVRHRNKIFFLLIIAYGLVADNKLIRRKNSKSNGRLEAK